MNIKRIVQSMHFMGIMTCILSTQVYADDWPKEGIFFKDSGVEIDKGTWDSCTSDDIQIKNLTGSHDLKIASGDEALVASKQASSSSYLGLEVKCKSNPNEENHRGYEKTYRCHINEGSESDLYQLWAKDKEKNSVPPFKYAVKVGVSNCTNAFNPWEDGCTCKWLIHSIMYSVTTL